MFLDKCALINYACLVSSWESICVCWLFGKSVDKRGGISENKYGVSFYFWKWQDLYQSDLSAEWKTGFGLNDKLLWLSFKLRLVSQTIVILFSWSCKII